MRTRRSLLYEDSKEPANRLAKKCDDSMCRRSERIRRKSIYSLQKSKGDDEVPSTTRRRRDSLAIPQHNNNDHILSQSSIVSETFVQKRRTSGRLRRRSVSPTQEKHDKTVEILRSTCEDDIPSPIPEDENNQVFLNSSHSDDILFITAIYEQKYYEPPKITGLPTVMENTNKRGRRAGGAAQSVNQPPIRRQIFTGQTLDEACAPHAAGLAPLDPDFVMSFVRKRINSRQRRAKKLGFKGICISNNTEVFFNEFISNTNLNSHTDGLLR